MKIMLSKALVLAVIVLFIGTGVVSSISGNNNFNGPPSIEWDKTYGGTEWDEANCVQQTNDGGYILAGCTISPGFLDAWLVKTDSSGNKLWDKTYGGTDYAIDYARCVQQTNDGGYILAGKTTSYMGGNDKFWLIKTDSSGNKLWDKTYGGAVFATANCVQQTNDGGYILAGCTISSGHLDAWLIKLATNYTGLISIEIHGGFRVSAVITNTGSETLTDVPRSIDLDGGLIITGSHSEGVIDELAPGATKTIRQSTLFGIGRTTITITVGDVTKQATAFILGRLVLGLKEL